MPTQCPDCDAWIYEGHCVVCGFRPPPARITHGAGTGVVVTPTGAPEITEAQRAQVKALVQGIVERLDGGGLSDVRAALGSQAPAVEDARVVFHADRLIRRGLEASTAYRLAIALVEDAGHRRTCEVCHGNDAPLRRLPPPGRWKAKLGPVPPKRVAEFLDAKEILARKRLNEIGRLNLPIPAGWEEVPG